MPEQEKGPSGIPAWVAAVIIVVGILTMSVILTAMVTFLLSM